MTENEIKNTKKWFEDFIETYALSNQETIEFKKAVACLEEIQQYRAIGTMKEVRMLKDYKELYDVYKLIATIEFSKEDMQKIVDEKVAQIELDIQGIRAKAIDELKNKICMHFADWKHSEDDKCIKDLIELASESVEEIVEQMKAEQMKAGGKNEND